MQANNTNARCVHGRIYCEINYQPVKLQQKKEKGQRPKYIKVIHRWIKISVSVLLTGAVGWLALQRHYLVFLLVRLHRQIGQVLLHLSGHLSVFVQLLGVEKRAATDSLLMGAALHIQHVGIGAALTQRPNEWKAEGRRGKEEGKGKEDNEGRQRWDEVNKVKDGQRDVEGRRKQRKCK